MKGIPKMEKLSKWLPGRLANVFAAAGKETPAHLVGMNYDKLYRIKGFAHASFHDLSKRLWDMGLHFDETGTIRSNVETAKDEVVIRVTRRQAQLLKDALFYLDDRGGFVDYKPSVAKIVEDLWDRLFKAFAAAGLDW